MQCFVLYVDDEPANLTVFEAAFARDMSVLTATNGAQALELMKTHSVAVLLTDQRMPGMTGVELAARAREAFPDTLRYLVTAFTDHDAAVEAINRGQIRRYLRKPWDPDELRSILLESVELYRSNARVRQLESRMVEVERVYTLGVVSASIAHELRNPLTGLTGSVDMALLSLRMIMEGESTRVSLDTVRKCLEDASELTAHLREVLRGIELNARGRSETRSCDPTEVVKLTLKLARNKLLSVGSVHTEIHPVPIARCSATGLSQVLLNLLSNAVDAMPQGRDPAEQRITIRLFARDDHVVLSVEDNGPGIPDSVRRSIFEPFFSTKGDSGTGLGLAISKKIIDESGGTLQCSSTAGRGTCFTLTLPAVLPSIQLAPDFAREVEAEREASL